MGHHWFHSGRSSFGTRAEFEVTKALSAQRMLKVFSLLCGRNLNSGQGHTRTKMRGNGLQLMEGRLRWDIRKK